MPAFFAPRHPQSSHAENRRIRLAERERLAREQDWQNRRNILPFF